MNVVVVIMHLVNGSVVEASVSATVPNYYAQKQLKKLLYYLQKIVQ